MDASRIDRINELYHKSQAVGLTEEEKEEQARLRQEYVAAIRGSLRNNLNNISIKSRTAPLRIWERNMAESRKSDAL